MTRNIGVLQALVAGFVLIRVAYVFLAGPASDEAYYWLWGQHPGWSYYDHPPFHAWLLGLSDLVFGNTLFGIRWLTFATLAGTAVIFRSWAERYAGEDWRPGFWGGLAVYLASPMFGVFSAMAFHDHLLVFLVLLSAHFFLGFFADYITRGRGRSLDLYLAAIALGCAGLTKYNAVFLGLAVFALVVTHKPLRPLLRSPHLWLAAALAIAMQAPILIWNFQHGFASFQFHLLGRHGEGWLSAINPATVGEFFGAGLLTLSPFLVPAFVRFFVSRPARVFETTGKTLAIWSFWLSSLTFFAISLSDYSWFWWNIVAYVVAMPFLAKFLREHWLFWGHIAYGGVVALYLLVSSIAVPLAIALGGEDFFRRSLYGWEQIEAPVAAAVAEHQPGFIAGATPELASIMAFAMDDPDVRSLQSRASQFDYWWTPTDHAGQSAIVITDNIGGLDWIEAQFATVTPIGEVPVDRYGVRLNTFTLYRAEGFSPLPRDED